MQHVGLDTHQKSTYTRINRRPRRLEEGPRADGSSFFALIILSLFALLLFNTACTSPVTPRQSINTTPTISVQSATIEQKITLAPTHTPQVTATPLPLQPSTEPMCLDQPGTLIEGRLEDATLPQGLIYRVYLPPCYIEDMEVRYPTLYLLHGLQANDSQWDELGVDECADALIASGETPPFLIIMPWHITSMDIETALVEILVPHIDQLYRTRDKPVWRAIGGLSRGGGWALRIGLRHPDLFGAIGLHSPAIFYSDPYIAAWIKDIHEQATPRIWLDVGEEDSLHDTTMSLIALLEELGAPYTSLLPAGNHDPEYWSAHLVDYLLWYTSGWQP